MAVYETTISERARPDWEQELHLARAEGGPGDVQLSPRYVAPRAMNWDGVYGRPGAVARGDLFCFVLSAYKPPDEPAEMVVYRVARTLGRTHGDRFDARSAGRPGWTDRLSGAIELNCVGFVRRDRFCAALGRGLRSPQRTQVCKGVAPGSVLAALELRVAAPTPVFANTTPAGAQAYHGRLCQARGAAVAEHAFFVYPRGRKLHNPLWDTYDCVAMCSNHAVSPYQTSTVGIVRYVCLGHPVLAAAASADTQGPAAATITPTPVGAALPKRKDRRSRAEKATGWGGPLRRKRRKTEVEAGATPVGNSTVQPSRSPHTAAATQLLAADVARQMPTVSMTGTTTPRRKNSAPASETGDSSAPHCSARMDEQAPESTDSAEGNHVGRGENVASQTRCEDGANNTPVALLQVAGRTVQESAYRRIDSCTDIVSRPNVGSTREPSPSTCLVEDTTIAQRPTKSARAASDSDDAQREGSSSMQSHSREPRRGGSASDSSGPGQDNRTLPVVADGGGVGNDAPPPEVKRSQQPPAQFCCPLTLEPMLDPVTLVSGHTYERDEVLRWIAEKERKAEALTDPMTGLALESNTIIPNIALRQLIGVWKDEQARDVQLPESQQPKVPDS